MHPTATLLLAWYGEHARDLPWRRSRDPYRIWVSEIMLQQTRVETVIPYYERFLARFPAVEELAAASEQDVLGLWAGLGYYRRARNLHRAARQVVVLGSVPDTVRGLRDLAGIGAYTAAAIASIAFGHDEVAVDGNVRRVVTRLAGIELPPERGEGARSLRGALLALLPVGRAGDFNQALMDLGATLCVPAGPRCTTCPLATECVARARGRQHELPVRAVRSPPRTVRAVAVVLHVGASILLVQRPDEGLLGGLWGPPDRVVEDNEVEEEVVRALLTSLGAPADVRPWDIGEVVHVFTHQRWRVRVYRASVPGLVGPTPRSIRWVPNRESPPLSRLADRILAAGEPRRGGGPNPA